MTATIDKSDTELLDSLDMLVRDNGRRWEASVEGNEIRIRAVAKGAERHGVRDAMRAMLALLHR